MSGNRRWAAFVLAALLPMMALGQAKPAEEKAAPKIDPKVAEILRQVSDFYKGLNSLSVDVSRTMTLTGPDVKREVAATYSVSMRRPNLFAFVLKDGKGGTLMCDGKSVFTYVPMLAKYTVREAPADLDALLTDAPETEMVTQAVFLPELLRNNPYEAMTEGVLNASYVGIEEVESAKCHHLKFEQQEFDWEMWAMAGEKPWVMKVAMDLAKSLPKGPQAPAGAQDMKLQVLVRFEGWAANPQLPDDRFKFSPPEAAQKVESLFAPMEDRPHPLSGKPAPDFTLDLLDGGQFDVAHGRPEHGRTGGKLTLSEHKGKQIVILDFWATWCPPCRRTMPIVAEVAAAYKDKGVLLYAVNEEEPVENVREFLKAQKLAVTVALDKDGKVGELYGATAIPQTVIVGKDGVVQVVHVGLLPDLKAKLTEELDALVAGNRPAGEAQQR